MQISLSAMLAFGNAGAVANVERALSQREQEDARVAALVAALAAREMAGSNPQPVTAPVAA